MQAQRLAAIARLKRWVGDRAGAPLQGSPPQWLLKPAQTNTQWHDGVAQHPELAGLRARLTLTDARVAAARANKRSDWAVLSGGGRACLAFGTSLDSGYTPAIHADIW